MLLDTLGHCGKRPIPRNGKLPILVGEPADICPTSILFTDPDVVALMEMVPSPHGPGSLSTIPRHELPSHLRELLAEADGWLAAYHAQSSSNHEANFINQCHDAGIDPRPYILARRAVAS